MKWLIASMVLISLAARAVADDVTISAEELADKIRGGLLAQIIGNLNGLPHEMKYIDEPGKVESYTPSLPEGARTDDDTDLEWIYVMEMEKSGELYPSPKRIRELWREHINRRIWCANAYARELMEVGFEPPLTGMKMFNPWSDFNISGQFICESFALMAPGMPQTGSKIALNFTRVTIEGEPAQTTQLFTTMIAMAFFESDIQKILDAGVAAIDPESEIHEIVGQVREWHREHPTDWKKTRELAKLKYTCCKGEMRDRNGYELNTASTIAALLYGGGDFVETLRIAFNFGWDADNNAATSATIIGVIRGRKWMDAQGWDIKDVYKNNSRDNVPEDETITKFGDRLIAVADKVILKSGGEKTVVDGREVYRIKQQSPANIELLRKSGMAGQKAAMKILSTLVADLSSEDAQRRAAAVYAAICLNQVDRLKTEQAEAWSRGVEDLKAYPKLVDALLKTPADFAGPLQEKVRGLGLEPEKK